MASVPLLSAVLKLDIAVTGFHRIHKTALVNIDVINDSSRELCSNIKSELRRWRSQYMTLMNYVVQWNETFNYILLVFIFDIFGNGIVNLYYLLKQRNQTIIEKINFSYSVGSLIYVSSLLFILCYVADRVKQEVGKLVSAW